MVRRTRGEFKISTATDIDKVLSMHYTSVSLDNVAQMSPCFIAEDNRLYLFTNIGPRLNQKIALAIADLPAR